MTPERLQEIRECAEADFDPDRKWVGHWKKMLAELLQDRDRILAAWRDEHEARAAYDEPGQPILAWESADDIRMRSRLERAIERRQQILSETPAAAVAEEVVREQAYRESDEGFATQLEALARLIRERTRST